MACGGPIPVNSEWRLRRVASASCAAIPRDGLSKKVDSSERSAVAKCRQRCYNKRKVIDRSAVPWLTDIAKREAEA